MIKIENNTINTTDTIFLFLFSLVSFLRFNILRHIHIAPSNNPKISRILTITVLYIPNAMQIESKSNGIKQSEIQNKIQA